MSTSIPSSSFAQFNADAQENALKATRGAAGLPQDIAFHRSIDPELADQLDAFSSRVLSLTNNLLALVATADPLQSNRKGKAKLDSQEDVVDDFHSLVVDSMDQLLERTDMCLDEFLGRNKPPQVAINYDAPKAAKRNPAPRGQLDPAIQHAFNLPKPQLSFKHPVNNSDELWYPALTHKFNAQVPLGHVYDDSADSIVNHPYRYEITHISYPQRMLVSAEPIPPIPFESSTATWVATPHALDAMLEALRSASEIAIDLEHNNYRTYAGMVCLMQISTRTQDWIVDTLALRAELATGDLNQVFTDPAIVKVFHGAESDIIWLQQDFNLYIVNLFDTFHASKLLEFPRHGLANLLEMYCDFVPDKRYQLADWRIRPLPEEMLQYARSDTHFLLFIYDNLRNALLDRALSRAQSQSRSPSPSSRTTPSQQTLIRQALSRSEETASRVYERNGSSGWDTLASKWNKGALVAAAETPRGRETLQRAVYRCVHAWRDMVARADDESTRYVLPNHYLFQLAERPPADMAALLQIFPSVPPVVRRRAKELLEAIRSCLRQYLEKPPDAGLPEKPTTPAETMDVDEKLVQTNSTAPTSTLFGVTKAAVAPLTSSTSSLFGSRSKGSSEIGGPKFQEVVARIHSALVIIPSMPAVAEDKSDIKQEGEPTHGMQVEIPYVPQEQRTTKQVPTVVDDSIVVVGQPRQKKRKRAKTDVSPAAASPAPKDEPDVEAFDFASVPNILDAVPNEEDMREKPTYGDFPAPPKAHSELKSGNKTYSSR
ncbi:ribonuclease H-like domain-containing protein [Roridomyces roridus]|uniref:Ribonuclease H-like domain-containing protein n=1 Tax=Roridomyces roridus TaxID=1738132 RepID=A0AAD7FQU4_9AGAR|nr:ribonuclease H-like domain-containing protein [Roridomyces roridus]